MQVCPGMLVVSAVNGVLALWIGFRLDLVAHS